MITRYLHCITGTWLTLFAVGGHALEESAEIPPTRAQQYLQVWLGSTEADDGWSLNNPVLGSELTADSSRLPMGGGGAQRLWGDRLQYGFEGGGLVSWKNDDVDYAGTSPGLLISIDGEFFMMDVFMGGVVAVRPTPWFRIYAAAGPSIAWGYLSGDEDDDDEPDQGGLVINGPNGIAVIDLDESDSDVSVTLYARAGLEFELGDGFTFGASVRYAEHEFDFDDRGELMLDEVQWLLTLGARL